MKVATYCTVPGAIFHGFATRTFAEKMFTKFLVQFARTRAAHTIRRPMLVFSSAPRHRCGIPCPHVTEFLKTPPRKHISATCSPRIRTAASHVTKHRRSQDFVWGCTFLPKKLTTFFSGRLQRPFKYTSKSKPPSKNCPKN